jgi:hypothetical protein
MTERPQEKPQEADSLESKIQIVEFLPGSAANGVPILLKDDQKDATVGDLLTYVLNEYEGSSNRTEDGMRYLSRVKAEAKGQYYLTVNGERVAPSTKIDVLAFEDEAGEEGVHYERLSISVAEDREGGYYN